MERERIDRYWAQRAEEFSGLRMKDYGGVMRGNYEAILREHMPDVANGTALDLGTGAGFFAMIMAGLGWRVTAIDYSAEMLEEAERNAAEHGFGDISFLRMDAQALTFVGESFDCVVSRNVTWTLPDPARAYAEMVRVLKPGGRLINFDANYGRAFVRAEERGEKPSHPTQTLEQLLERNEIAKSLYICEKDRPFWDIDVLHSLGLYRFELDLEIDRRICAGSTREKVYAGIPKDDRDGLFMLCARKMCVSPLSCPPA